LTGGSRPIGGYATSFPEPSSARQAISLETNASTLHRCGIGLAPCRAFNTHGTLWLLPEEGSMPPVFNARPTVLTEQGQASRFDSAHQIITLALSAGHRTTPGACGNTSSQRVGVRPSRPSAAMGQGTAIRLTVVSLPGTLSLSSSRTFRSALARRPTAATRSTGIVLSQAIEMPKGVRKFEEKDCTGYLPVYF